MSSIQTTEFLQQNGTTIPENAMTELKKTVNGEIILKGQGEKYIEAIHRWNEAYITEAAIVVMVESEQDISTCILWAQKHNVDLAIAGGRHSFHGASSTSGLVIDMRRMKSVVIDKEGMRITAQGGCLAEDVEKIAYVEGLMVVMGAVNETGIGGLSLGGGTGWLSGEFGHIVDNILGVRLITADGQIRVCNEKENSDLFWGIRGGGSNFGVVSEFVYKAHWQGEVFFGAVVFAPEKAKDVFNLADVIYNQAIVPSNGKFAAYPALMSPQGASITPLLLVFYNGPEAEGRRLAQPIYDLGPVMDGAQMVPYPLINESHKMFPTPGIDRKTSSVVQFSFPIDKDVLETLMDEFKAVMVKYGKRIEHSRLLMELRNHKVTASVPVHATAYASRHEAINVAVEFMYAEAELDIPMRDEAREIAQNARRRMAEKRGGQGTEVLVNANFTSGTEKIKNVFGANLQRLSELKRTYDPDMVFNKWYPVPPVAQ